VSQHVSSTNGRAITIIVTYVTGCLNMYPVRTAVLLLIPAGFNVLDELLHESEVRALNLGVVGYVVVYKLIGLGPRLRLQIGFFVLRLGFSKLGGASPVKLFRESEHLGEDLVSGTCFGVQFRRGLTFSTSMQVEAKFSSCLRLEEVSLVNMVLLEVCAGGAWLLAIFGSIPDATKRDPRAT